MEIYQDGSKLTVRGNVKSVVDSREVGEKLDQTAREFREIRLELADSMACPSTLIGRIHKVLNFHMSTAGMQQQRESVKVHVAYGDERVGQVLESLRGHIGFTHSKI